MRGIFILADARCSEVPQTLERSDRLRWSSAAGFSGPLDFEIRTSPIRLEIRRRIVARHHRNAINLFHLRATVRVKHSGVIIKVLERHGGSGCHFLNGH